MRSTAPLFRRVSWNRIKLLRVLQDGAFLKVGGTQPCLVNVRIIAATNSNLEQAIREKHFREDLFYRLNVIRIDLPPLRERQEDIPLLTLVWYPGRTITGSSRTWSSGRWQ